MHLGQLTGTIDADRRNNKQVLDKLKVERERGITGQFSQIVTFNIKSNEIIAQ